MDLNKFSNLQFNNLINIYIKDFVQIKKKYNNNFNKPLSKCLWANTLRITNKIII